RCYESLLAKKQINTDSASRWSLDVLAVEAEAVINSHGKDTVFVDFCYSQFEKMIDQSQLPAGSQSDDFGAALYIAIHQALLKADLAAIRAGLLRRYQVDSDNLDQYVLVNQRIDTM